MLPAKRRARIIEVLRREGAASLRDLADQLDMSISTIRRDVDYLCETGLLSRTHGGAMLDEGAARGRETEPAIAAEIERAAKAAIGARAAALLAPGRTAIFDSGSTVAAAAEAALDAGAPFTAVTNDLRIGALFGESERVETVLPGGRVRPGSSTLIGAGCVRAIERLHADIAFIGAHAVAPEGLSDTSAELAEVKRAILGAADLVVLAADSTKFFSRAFCLFGELRQVDLIVTDDRLPDDKLAELEGRGLRVDRVPLAAGVEGEAEPAPEATPSAARPDPAAPPGAPEGDAAS